MNFGFEKWRISRTCLAICLAVALGVIFAPALVMAQEEDEPTQADGLMALRTANDAFEQEDFETAYENYEKAFEILGVAQVKYRMGQTAEKLGEVDTAIEHYEAYQEIGEDEELLARVDEALPGLLAEREEAQAAEEPDEIVVPEELAQADGEKESDEPDDASLTVQEPEEVSESSLSMWGWTTAGVGVAVLAVGGVMSFLQAGATQQVNDYDRASQGQGASQAELDSMREEIAGHRSDAETYHQAALGSYIAGGLLTVVGAGILGFEMFRPGDDSSVDDGFSLQGGVGPDGGFVGFQGRF